MTLVTPPRNPAVDDDHDLAQRVADLEALIEEARRRARRRRIRNVTAAAVAAAAVVAGLIGFHGGGGGGAGAAALAGDSSASGHAREPAPSLAALPAGDRAWAFAFDPRRPNVVYVASPDARGAYVYKTTDDGRHWHKTAAREAGWMSDILSLAADPRQPGTLYAGTDTAVYKTVDGGRSWRPFNQGLFPPNGGQQVCYRPVGGRPYCAKLPFGTPGQPDWNRNNGWVLDVAVDPLDSNVVYSAADAVRKSTDGGHTWRTVLPANARQWKYNSVSRIAIAPTRPESIYAIAHDLRNGATAIYKSTDAGKKWQAIGRGAGLPSSDSWDSTDALAVDRQHPETLYAAIGGIVLSTTDGGGSWQPMMNGLPDHGVTSLAAAPGTVYASVDIAHVFKTKTTTSGGIYETTDGGQTWSAVYSGFGIDKVAVDPTRPSTIYATGWAGRDRTHPNAWRLLRSTDRGRTWAIAR